jgi:colanic acid biosynthesis glycosyl transferase WcaI
VRILVIADYYKPDGGPGASLYTMLCEELVRLGNEVTVVTTVPHFPSGEVKREYKSWRIKNTLENGVNVIRVPLPSVNRSKLQARMIQFLAFQVGATLASIRKQYDVLLTHTPALEVWLPFMSHRLLIRKPIVYSVHDVYPDVGVKLGYFHNPTVIKLVGWLEKSCLNSATKIRVLSNSFIPGLLSRGIPENKISLIYDWAELDPIKAIPQENSFSLEHKLANRFIVLYAGNIGTIQGLDSALEAANQLKDETEIHFIFVGDGGARAELIQKAKELNLNNVEFLPYQPRERMPEILACADIALVSLRKGMSFGALPSKTYSILASGRPLIACVDPGSDVWDLVERAQAGLCVEPESPGQLVDAIKKLKTKPELLSEMGKNGRNYIQKYHSPRYAAMAFENMLSSTIGKILS